MKAHHKGSPSLKSLAARDEARPGSYGETRVERERARRVGGRQQTRDAGTHLPCKLLRPIYRVLKPACLDQTGHSLLSIKCHHVLKKKKKKICLGSRKPSITKKGKWLNIRGMVETLVTPLPGNGYSSTTVPPTWQRR